MHNLYRFGTAVSGNNSVPIRYKMLCGKNCIGSVRKITDDNLYRFGTAVSGNNSVPIRYKML
jgi:hypothetical protein